MRHQLPRRAVHRGRALRRCWRCCSTSCWSVAQRLMTPVDHGRRRHERLRRHLGLPLDADELAGARRHARPCWSSSCCVGVTALVLAVLIGLPIALWLGHLGRGGLPGDQHLQRRPRRSRPSRCWRCWSPPTGPGTDSFGPYGRAGLATLIALTLFALPPIITNAYVAVREVPDDVKESADGMGMTGRPEVLPGRAAAGAAAGHVRRPPGAGAGLGDRDHRRPRRRARASAG